MSKNITSKVVNGLLLGAALTLAAGTASAQTTGKKIVLVGTGQLVAAAPAAAPAAAADTGVKLRQIVVEQAAQPAAATAVAAAPVVAAPVQVAAADAAVQQPAEAAAVAAPAVAAAPAPQAVAQTTVQVQAVDAPGPNDQPAVTEVLPQAQEFVPVEPAHKKVVIVKKKRKVYAAYDNGYDGYVSYKPRKKRYVTGYNSGGYGSSCH
jgi:hypothetical protein